MRLVVEKYRTKSGSDSPEEPIVVTFRRYNKDFLVSAIMEFLEHNFVMHHYPKYRDSEGDLILLDSRDAYAVCFLTYNSWLN